MIGEKKYTENPNHARLHRSGGARCYFKCPLLRELTDGAIQAILHYTEQMPPEQPNAGGP